MARYLLVVLACLLLAAHHLRVGDYGLVVLWASAPTLLLLARPWTAQALQLLLVVGCGIWGHTAFGFIANRLAFGAPWQRLAVILGALILLTAAAAQTLSSQPMVKRFGGGRAGGGWSLAAFIVTATLLTIVQRVVEPPAILLERFVPGGGWLTCFWLAVWAAWLAEVLASPERMRKLRPLIWMAFSTVFFLQLALGLAGMEKFLMTGELHLPVPALIVAGPIYRGGGLFMLILLLSTLLVVGPAWCSWLCYIGAWDDRFARAATPPKPLPGWRRHLRLLLLAVVIAAAAALNYAGASPAIAGVLALAFGILGVAVMAWASRATGAMVHCTSYCPIGLVATRLGRLSPFRLRITDSCTRCGACSLSCRYDALHEHHVDSKLPGEACTLCGDCVAVCGNRAIEYRFLGLQPNTARRLFIMLVASVHAVFVGVARM